MPQRTLRFRIRQDGLVEELVQGVQGDACQLITNRLEADLGTVQKKQPTSDAFLAPQKDIQTISAELN